jgi:pimeloyl-ACP methyl ester carboxylesterase
VTSFANNGSVRVAYELVAHTNGRGPARRPLLLIQGLGYERHGFGPAVETLAATRTLVLFDNRGSGESDKPPGPYTVRDLAQDAISVLAAASIDRVDVVGISLGGMVAQEVALGFPTLVARLVLACTTPGVRGYPMPQRTVSLMAAAPSLPFEEALRRLVENALADTTVATRPELVEEIMRYRRAHPPDLGGWQALTAAAAGFDALDRLGSIRAPTLVLHGADDHVVDDRNAELLAERIDESRLHRFPAAGHLFVWEEPAAFAATVLDFLDADEP